MPNGVSANVKAQIRLPSATGLPEDDVINGLHFYGQAAVVAADWTNVAGWIGAMYTTAYAGMVHALSFYMTDVITSAAGCSISFYDLSDPEPRVPFQVEQFTMNGNAGSPQPGEVALCISLATTTPAADPVRTRRNRFYLGRLAQNALSGGGPPSRPDTVAFYPDVQKAMAATKAGLAAITAVDWIVYSQKQQTLDGSGGGDATHRREVSSGWIDNGWDSQRRRGYAATSRTTF